MPGHRSVDSEKVRLSNPNRTADVPEMGNAVRVGSFPVPFDAAQQERNKRDLGWIDADACSDR
jgi:hypothetical protein